MTAPDVTTAQLSLPVKQSATFVREFTWTLGNAVPVDLTDATIHLQIRDQPSSAGTLILGLAIDSGITLTDPMNGVFTVTITATQTALLSTASALFYDVRVTFTDATVAYPLEGRVFVSPSVST